MRKMVEENEKMVMANAIEVYIQLLRGNTKKYAMDMRPYKENKYELDVALDLSCDK